MSTSLGPRARFSLVLASASLLVIGAASSVFAQETSGELILTAVPLPSGLATVPLYAVIEGGPGFIAVGGGWPEDADEPLSLILTSVDGIEWQAVDLEGLVESAELRDVVAFPGGYAAVGYRTGSGGNDAVALTSQDGLAWQQAQDEDLEGAGMFGVTAWENGLFGVGCTVGESCIDPMGFVSDDGREWTRVPLPGPFWAPGAVAAADGLLVVLGVSSEIADGRPVTATTTDLSTWTRRELAFDGGLADAEVFGRRIVAAGVAINQPDAGTRGVVVYSPNAGKTWIQLPDTAPDESFFEGLSTAGPTIAHGSILGSDDKVHPGAWVTRVGADWERIRPATPTNELGSIIDYLPFPDRPGGIAVGGGGPVRELAAAAIAPAGS